MSRSRFTSFSLAVAIAALAVRTHPGADAADAVSDPAMPFPRPLMRRSLQALLCALLASVTPHRVAAEAPSAACAARWSVFETAVKSGDLQAAVSGERTLATTPGCNPQRVQARQVMLDLYRDEAARLKTANAPLNQQLAALEAALGYANAWNGWDIHAKIGDLKRRLPSANGAPDPAAASLAYDAAVKAIDLAPPAARPPAAEIERIMALAYQYEALSPVPVGRRAMLTRTARQINVERTPVPLQFVYDRDQLTEAGQAQARSLLQLLKEEGMPPIHLVGHTDPVGSDAYNDRLSVLRARAVGKFLIAGGYPAERISTEGRGKRDIDKLKIVDRNTFTVDEVHQMLRRVELVWKDPRNPPVLVLGERAPPQQPAPTPVREIETGPVRLRIPGMAAAEQRRVVASLDNAALVGDGEPAALIWDARRQLILNDQGRRIAEDVDAGQLQHAIDQRRALERLIDMSAASAITVRIRPRDQPADAPPSAASDATHKAGTILYVDVGGIADGAYFTVFNLTGNGKVELIEPAPAHDRCEGLGCATGTRKAKGAPISPLEVLVRAPYGAEHVVAVAGALPLSRLMPALGRTHGRLAVAELMAALASELQTQPLQAGFRGIYSARE